MNRRWWRTATVAVGAGVLVVVAGVPAYAQSRVGSVVIKSDTTNYQVVARHSGKCLDLDNGSPDDGTPIIQWSCHSGLNQRWQLQLVSAGAVGTYQVVAAPTGKCMGVLGFSRADGASVVQLPCTRQRDRLWRVSEVSEGFLRFVAVISGKCLDVRDVSQQDGARMQQWACTDGANQQFTIHEA